MNKAVLAVVTGSVVVCLFWVATIPMAILTSGLSIMFAIVMVAKQ